MEDLSEKSTVQPQPEDGAGEAENAAQAAWGEGESPPGQQTAEPEPVAPPVAEAPEAVPTKGTQPAASEAAPTTNEQPPVAASGQPDETVAVEPAEAATPEVPATSAAEPTEAPATESIEISAAEPIAPAAAEQTAEPAIAQQTEPAAAESAQPAPSKGIQAEEQPAPAEPAAPQPTGPRMGDLHSGMVVEGTITRIERYGAFVNLGLVERRDGLIHISELSPHRIRRVEDVVRVGDEVRARVVAVDMERGRISLSLNDVDEGRGTAEAASSPAEPTLTAMQLAFERAYSRRREEERQRPSRSRREDVGDKRKREHESLMNRLRTGSR